MDLLRETNEDGREVEHVLAEAIEHATPPRLRDALRHAVLTGGGRVRPRFCLAVVRAAGSAEPQPVAVACAAALELMHCASLVHDDLPCFDDAATRRGQPSVHRAYGEPLAVLVGDALIVAAFETLARASAPSSAVLALARASGHRGGLVSGQSLELEGPAVDVEAYHSAKTAALFEAAGAIGAALVGRAPAPFAALGRELGLFYQLADDAADAFGAASVLGKPVGLDLAHDRPSAVVPKSRVGAGAQLLRAMRPVLAAVPDCPGHDMLRAFVTVVLETIIERSGVGATLQSAAGE